jgi:hypothetical protein
MLMIIMLLQQPSGKLISLIMCSSSATADWKQMARERGRGVASGGEGEDEGKGEEGGEMLPGVKMWGTEETRAASHLRKGVSHLMSDLRHETSGVYCEILDLWWTVQSGPLTL